MKRLTLALLACTISALGAAQNHDLKPAEALKMLDFMKGKWSGKQEFVIPNGSMVGDATNDIDDAIGGRYLCEMLSTTLNGRKPTDTRHFITYDAKAAKYKAWWYTDTTVGPMEFEGNMDGNKLVMLSKPTDPARPVLKVTYDAPATKTLTYTLEMKSKEGWTRLFVITYTKK